VPVPASLRIAWASPASALGLVMTALLLPFGAELRVLKGVLEVCLRSRSSSSGSQESDRRLPFAAITFGHVVIARTHADHVRLRAHERVHVKQYERWAVLFLLAYPAESLLQLLLGRRPHLDNRFEVQARVQAAVSQGGAASRVSSPGESHP
jgi:hypothetical protein